MTIFIRPPRLLDESASELRTRSQTLLESAEHAIPVSGDDVVEAVQHRGWQHARKDCRLPRPPKLAGDEQRCLAPGEYPGVTRPIVRQNVERRQIGAVAVETFNHRSASCALERSEREHAAPVVGEKELEQAVAQPADSVVEDQVSGFGERWHLHR
jgi:hypothetical protein